MKKLLNIGALILYYYALAGGFTLFIIYVRNEILLFIFPLAFIFLALLPFLKLIKEIMEE